MPRLKANEIDARPTKEFFITAITRDVNLIEAIPDLIDNSYDGAIRIGKKNNMKGLVVEIEIDKDHFKIKDNCGGISKDLAKNYAFRFGRDKTFKEQLKGNVGLYGVGMKRAIFRLGNKAKIESKTRNEHFLVEIDVEDWKGKEDEWTFEFKDINNSAHTELNVPGVILEVYELYKNVSETFDNDQFIADLKEEIEKKCSEYIRKHLTIILNGKPVGYEQLKILESEDISPSYKKWDIGTGDKKVTVEIVVGFVSEESRSPRTAGWYIFCNGRLVLHADKSSETGWGKVFPFWNNQYAYFRGFVFFSSKNPSQLPWNTTKTQINTDSSIFRVVMLEMEKLASPIFEFLRKLARERKKDEEGHKPEDQPLLEIMRKAEEKEVSNLTLKERVFKIPKPKTKEKPKPKESTISYKRLQGRVNKVKKKLKVRSNSEVGIKTFEYYYKHEVKGGS